ncbi:MAG: methyltransferase [Gemmatirosa sp.]|nr:methyltransferase [Gemmatirosa sp.]
MTSTSDYPIHLGPADEFAAARALLTLARYDEPTVARRLGGTTLFGFPRLSDGRKTVGGAVEDANAALIRLLLDGETLPATLLRELWGDVGADALESLGVVVPDAADASLRRATVMLSPVSGVWVAQDLPPHGPHPDPSLVPRDFVFPALSSLTQEFLAAVDDAPGQRVLELCAGAGLGALRAVRRGAAEAWATDITGRSAHFACWNAALNGLDAVHAVVSDVWEGLAGETFDRVMAHPPYVPALAHVFDFRDAGADGEQVTRRIVEGLPAHLRDGGRCAITAALTDRRGDPVEHRIRTWLGDAEAEFDLVVLQRRDWDVLHSYRNVSGQKRGYVNAEAWLTHFESLDIEQFVLCAFELRRDAKGRAPITLRRRAGKVLDAAAMDFQFRWGRLLERPGTPLDRVAGLRPRVVPGTQVLVTLRADDDRDWHTVGATVETDYPAQGAVPAPALAPTLLELCDGTRDVAALLAGLRDAGLVTDEVSPADVAPLVELMLTAGTLEVEECPVPKRPAALTA